MVNLNQALLFGTSFLREPDILPWVLPENITTLEGAGSIAFGRQTRYSYFLYPPSGEYVEDFSVQENEFTIEWFQWMQSEIGSAPRIFSIGQYPDAALAVSIEGNTLYFWMGGINQSFQPDSSLISASLPSGFTENWRHIAISRDSNNLVRIYYDGQMIASQTSTVNVVNNTSALFIGNERNDTLSTQYRGYLTDFHFVNGEALYISDEGLSIPVSPIDPVADTKLLLNTFGPSNFLADSSSRNRIASQPFGLEWFNYSPYDVLP